MHEFDDLEGFLFNCFIQLINRKHRNEIRNLRLDKSLSAVSFYK